MEGFMLVMLLTVIKGIEDSCVVYHNLMDNTRLAQGMNISVESDSIIVFLHVSFNFTFTKRPFAFLQRFDNGNAAWSFFYIVLFQDFNYTHEQIFLEQMIHRCKYKDKIVLRKEQ
jgi:hypothetical protein